MSAEWNNQPGAGGRVRRLGWALRIASAFLAATLATAVAGSIVQTQINLAAIAALGAPVTPDVRLEATAGDLLTFGPVMAAIAATAFLPAFAVGHFAARALPPRWRAPVLAAGGVVGLWAAFVVMGYFTPMPALVAAVRGPGGLTLVSMTGMLGGLVHARLTHPGATAR